MKNIIIWTRLIFKIQNKTKLKYTNIKNETTWLTSLKCPPKCSQYLPCTNGPVKKSFFGLWAMYTLTSICGGSHRICTAMSRSPLGEANTQELELPNGSIDPIPKWLLFDSVCQAIHLATNCSPTIWWWLIWQRIRSRSSCGS